jgi:hypothetical protein
METFLKDWLNEETCSPSPFPYLETCSPFLLLHQVSLFAVTPNGPHWRREAQAWPLAALCQSRGQSAKRELSGRHWLRVMEGESLFDVIVLIHESLAFYSLACLDIGIPHLGWQLPLLVFLALSLLLRMGNKADY